MPVLFPNVEAWDGTRMVVSFPADSSGARLNCAVSIEALQDHFEGDNQEPLAAFRAHRRQIEQVAERLILRQRFEADGSILVRTQDC